MIPVDTPKGRFRVWTKRIGNIRDLGVALGADTPSGSVKEHPQLAMSGCLRLY